MTSRQWTKTVLISFFISSLALIGINYTVDPMQEYRKSSFYPVYFDTDKERYLNAGLAKNYDYDAIVLGTSHTENFILSEVEKNLDYHRTIKLSIRGGSAKEQSITLKTAIDHNPKLRNVLWGLDILSFEGDPTRKSHMGAFPMYLYDNNLLNDYRYVYSLDTFINSLEALVFPVIKAKDDPYFDVNRMYQWQHIIGKHQFTTKHIVKKYNKFKRLYAQKNKTDASFDHLKNSFDFNFLNLIKKNPQIDFKVFFPPYSILNFKLSEENQILSDTLAFKAYVVEQLSDLPNVMIYDFQVEKNVIMNLYNYKDPHHYHQKINTWMLEQMNQGHYLVTKENIKENIRTLEEEVKNYTFDTKSM